MNPQKDTGIVSWNPRCLKRDLTDYINQNFANASNVLSAVQNYTDINTFQLLFRGWPDALVAGGTTLGVHGGGMYSQPAGWLPLLAGRRPGPRPVVMSRPETLRSECTAR